MSKQISAFLLRPAPSKLFHYTSQAGMLGIVKSRTIWLSHTQYLNDDAEFLHATRIAQEILDTLSHSTLGAHPFRDVVLSETKAERANVLVASFSEAPDSLSQWRAYGDTSGVFALGFSSEALQTAVVAEGFRLVPCIYNRETQRQFMEAVISDALEDCGPGGQWEGLPGGRLVTSLYRYAPILKHHSFEEEQEWRIISLPLEPIDPGFEYRQGVVAPIPYYTLPLKDGDGEPVLHSITVGPSRRPDLSERSVRGLLAKYGYAGAAVYRTATPFRAA